MGCGDNCIKFLLITFNFIFALIGLAFIVIGSLYLSNEASFDELVDVDGGVKTSQIFLIVVGVIIFAIAALGCCGAIYENKCMLITFAVLLLFIFIVQLAIGIYSVTHTSDVTQSVEKGMREQFQKIETDINVRRIFEKLETDWECCGVKGAQDYEPILHAVPESCCRDKNKCRNRPFDYWSNGCASVLTNFTGKAGQVLGGVAIALSIIEIFGAVFALRLANKIR